MPRNLKPGLCADISRHVPPVLAEATSLHGLFRPEPETPLYVFVACPSIPSLQSPESLMVFRVQGLLLPDRSQLCGIPCAALHEVLRPYGPSFVHSIAFRFIGFREPF